MKHGEYRKLPVVLKAAQWEGWPPENPPDWLANAIERKIVHQGRTVTSRTGFFVNSPEGMVFGRKGSWIMLGLDGELYIVDEAMFPKLYEEVT